MTKAVLFIQSTGSWWDHRYFYKQMPALVDEGFEVSYLVREAKDLGFDERRSISFFKLSGRKAKITRLTGGLNLLGFVIKKRFPMIQLCNIELLPLGILLSIVTKKKIFYDCREDHFHAMLHGKTWFPKWFRYCLAGGVKFLEFFADVTFSGLIVSDPALYKSHSCAKRSRKIIFYNMALLSQFRTKKFYLSEDIQNKVIDIVVLGSMSIRTGVLDVVKAMAIFKKKGIDLNLKLIGDPTFDKTLWGKMSDIIEASKLQDNIIITGRVPYDQIPLELANCKIGIIPLLDIPKFQNNMATKQFEYMAAGVAVIATDLLPQRNFLKNDINALFYEPGDAEGLGKKIEELLLDRRKWLFLVNNAASRIRSDWNSEAQQIKYKRFYSLRMSGFDYTECQIPPFEND